MCPFAFFALTDFDVEGLEKTRAVIAESCDVLQQNPVPDTFVGRKTQEPFPTEDDELGR